MDYELRYDALSKIERDCLYKEFCILYDLEYDLYYTRMLNPHTKNNFKIFIQNYFKMIDRNRKIEDILYNSSDENPVKKSN